MKKISTLNESTTTMIAKEYYIYKFTYSLPTTSNISNQILIITTGWPPAFNIMYDRFGDSVIIRSVDFLGIEGQSCIIDPSYSIERSH